MMDGFLNRAKFEDYNRDNPWLRLIAIKKV